MKDAGSRLRVYRGPLAVAVFVIAATYSVVGRRGSAGSPGRTPGPGPATGRLHRAGPGDSRGTAGPTGRSSARRPRARRLLRQHPGSPSRQCLRRLPLSRLRVRRLAVDRDRHGQQRHRGPRSHGPAQPAPCALRGQRRLLPEHDAEPALRVALRGPVRPGPRRQRAVFDRRRHRLGAGRRLHRRDVLRSREDDDSAVGSGTLPADRARRDGGILRRPSRETWILWSITRRTSCRPAPSRTPFPDAISGPRRQPARARPTRAMRSGRRCRPASTPTRSTCRASPPSFRRPPEAT